MLLCVGTSQNGTDAKGWMYKHETKQNTAASQAMTSLLFVLFGFGIRFIDRHRTGVVSFWTMY